VLRRHSTMFGLILALVGWISASLLWAGDLGAAANDFWYWLVAAAIAVVIATTLNTPRHLIAICGAFVLGAVFTVVIASVQGTASEVALATQEAGRLGAGLQDPNYLAAGLVPGAALAAGLLPVVKSRLTKLALGVALVALAGGLVATGSRGGLVAAGIAVVAALVIARGRRLRIGSLLVLVVAVAGGWFVTSSPETLERVQEFEGGSGRVDLWQVALRMSGDNPVLGVGTNNFAVQSADYVLQPGRLENVELIVDTPQVVHNAYLQQLAETGIIGLALWLAVLGSAIAASWTAARRLERDRDTGLAALAQAVVVAQIGALGASIFLSNGYDKRLWILFALGPVLMTIAEARRTDGT
jgi:O-antigen ligase